MSNFKIQVLSEGTLPTLAHKGDAGFDLSSTKEVVLEPLERVLIPTGIKISIPEGYVALIHPRSGLSSKYGITVINTPGTIDSGYRGEIKVAIINLSKDVFKIEKGMRIAQMLIQKVETPEWEIVKELEDSTRGSSGFGSSGI